MRFVGVIFAFFGLWCLAVGISMGMEEIKAKRWPRARGRIIKSRVEELRTSSRIRVARLCLSLDYLYMVGDKIFEGHRLDSGWRCFASEDHIRQVLKRYPTGREVKVFYNPKNPQKSLLEPGISWSVLFLTGIGIINLSIAMPLIRSGRKRLAV